MSILIFALIVIIVVALLVYAVDMFPIPSPFGRLIQGLIIVIGALIIIQRAGLL